MSGDNAGTRGLAGTVPTPSRVNAEVFDLVQSKTVPADTRVPANTTHLTPAAASRFPDLANRPLVVEARDGTTVMVRVGEERVWLKREDVAGE